MDIEINEVQEIIKNLESGGELSIKEEKYLKVAKLCLQLAAENVQIKAMNDCLSEELRGYESDGAFEGPKMHLLWWQVETPATDRIVAGIKADAAAPLVSALKVIANSEQHNGDTVVCDFDTLISVAAGALRDYYAQQLREGADK